MPTPCGRISGPDTCKATQGGCAFALSLDRALPLARIEWDLADGLGFRYALSDGYDVRKMVNMFETLQRVSATAGQRIPEWQSTHPDPGNRIAATEARLKRNTIPLDEHRRSCDKINVLSIAPLLGEAIRRTHTNSSISSLFI